jgi:hypothetical protein
MVPKPLGIANSKATQNVPRSNDYNVGTELILLSVCDFDEFWMVHAINRKNVR